MTLLAEYGATLVYSALFQIRHCHARACALLAQKYLSSLWQFWFIWFLPYFTINGFLIQIGQEKSYFSSFFHHSLCTIDESIKGAASQNRYDITFDGNINVLYIFQSVCIYLIFPLPENGRKLSILSFEDLTNIVRRRKCIQINNAPYVNIATHCRNYNIHISILLMKKILD